MATITKNTNGSIDIIADGSQYNVSTGSTIVASDPNGTQNYIVLYNTLLPNGRLPLKVSSITSINGSAPPGSYTALITLLGESVFELSGGNSATNGVVTTSALLLVTLSTTITALASNACRFIEILNNAVGAVDINYYKGADTTNYAIIPAGTVRRVYCSNTNQVSLKASTGTPIISIEFYN